MVRRAVVPGEEGFDTEGGSGEEGFDTEGGSEEDGDIEAWD